MVCILCGAYLMACGECGTVECGTPLCRQCKAVAREAHEDPVRVGTSLDGRRVVYLPED
jgi:hypothetical protein